MTIIMTPDQQPFFAATYIPKQNRFNRPGLLELLPRIQEIWQQRKEDVRRSTAGIMEALQKEEPALGAQEVDISLLDQAFAQTAARFDALNGGFGRAPKFPTAHTFFFLLRYWKRTRDPQALNMVEQTLQAIRRGGIFDQVGFGFHRYATDPEWLVPHFEKMLHDQALLALAFLETFQATRKKEYADTAEEIFTYVLRDLRAPGGGFFSAEDADSEGEEGKFYLWKEEELGKVLPEAEARIVLKAFHTAAQGNFQQEATGLKTGDNLLRLRGSLADTAAALGLSLPELQKILVSARAALLAERSKRVRPLLDDKILTDWNGLMIAALARGARVLNRPDYAEAAAEAAGFIRRTMCRPEGRLRHRFRAEEAAIDGLLDDYAFLSWGMLELYEATFETSYLRNSLEGMEHLLRNFWGPDQGGFYFTPQDGEALIMRPREFYDSALPSGNSVAFHVLLRLARITARPDLAEKAAELAKAFAARARQYPAGYTHFLSGLDFALGPAREIVIVGSGRAEKTRAMLAAVRSIFLPNDVLITHDLDKGPPDRVLFNSGLNNPAISGSETLALICGADACQNPVKDPEALREILNQHPA